MSRPYLTWSIVQLEAEFERAQDDGDQAALKLLESELKVRTTDRAVKLRLSLEDFLGKRAKASPPPAAKNEPSRPSAKKIIAQGKSEKSTLRDEPNPARKPRLTLKPTSEQQDAIDQFKKGGSLRINAYAGTGKTSTLEMLAHSTSRTGQYIAFNRSIVAEAREKFPSSVNCSTLHGLAFKATPSKFKSNTEKMTGKLNAHKLAETLKLKRWQVDKAHTLVPRSQGYLILETIRKFLHSADIEPEAKHVPRHGSLLAAPEATVNAVTDFALHASKHVWDRMRDENDEFPLGHDGYLKLWAQSSPSIAADFILLDEAQDTNPVILDVLRKQPAQMIYVGDRYQQIYEWRGAVNAMEEIKTDYSTDLRKSFRFGEKIAEAASKVLLLLNEKKRILGNSAINSRIGSVVPDTILARTNASTITAIIESLDAGKSPHLVGGTDEIMDMLRGVQDLKAGNQSTVPDFFGFDKWDQVVEFAKSGEGGHLLTFVNLVETRGEKQLMWALGRTVDDEKGDITISTVHKAKGREWRNVKLMDDFFRSQPASQKPQEKPGLIGHDAAELRLFYVALTRAKEAVEVPSAVMSLISSSSA